ncbi:RICIN domain-containing protein [Actinoplanes sp. NPDC000266]
MTMSACGPEYVLTRLGTLAPVAGLANTYTVANQQTGKCVDVSGISTAARARIHQWTCNPVNQNDPLNQTWRLLGR